MNERDGIRNDLWNLAGSYGLSNSTHAPAPSGDARETALAAYSRHWDGCEKLDLAGEKPCSCGLDAARSSLDARETALRSLVETWRKESAEWVHGLGPNSRSRALDKHAAELEALLTGKP